MRKGRSVIRRGRWGLGKGKEGRGYLCSTSGILRRTACDEFCVVVLEQVLVEAHVFFFGENGVVGLEAVFGEGGFITTGSGFSMLRMT